MTSRTDAGGSRPGAVPAVGGGGSDVDDDGFAPPDDGSRDQRRLGGGQSRKRSRGTSSAAAAQQLIQAWHEAALWDNPNLTPCLSDEYDTEGDGDDDNARRQRDGAGLSPPFATAASAVAIDRPTRNHNHQMLVRRGTEDSINSLSSEDDLAKKGPYYDQAGVLAVTGMRTQSSVSSIELEDMAAGRSGCIDPSSDEEEEDGEEQQKKKKALGLGGDSNLGAAGTASALGAALGAAYVFKDYHACDDVAAAAAEGAGHCIGDVGGEVAAAAGAEELGGVAAEELGGAAAEELGGAAAEELGGAAAEELGGAAAEELGAEGMMFAMVKARMFADKLMRKMKDDEEDDDDNEAAHQIQEQVGDQGFEEVVQMDVTQFNTTATGPAPGPGPGPPAGAEQLLVAQAMLSQAASGIASSAAAAGGAAGAVGAAAAAAATAGAAGKPCIVTCTTLVLS